MSLKIHQFVHTLSYGDAISGVAIATKRILEEQGIYSEIYSLHAHEKVQHLAKNYREFSEDGGAVILRYSLGSPLNELFASLANSKRVLVYHNLTPAHWFRGYNRRVYDDLVSGREELPKLLDNADILLADSTFNQQELSSMGGRSVNVLPLLFDPKRWSEPKNAGISALLQKPMVLQDGTPVRNFLHIGRKAPNKCIEDIIKPFYFYHHKINRNSRLWLVGHDIDTEIYTLELRRLVSELRLKEAVQFVPGGADSEIRAFYEGCDCYIAMSEHEGFCMPVLEAMNFSLPVIAYDGGATAETLGAGGLLVKSKSPAEVAELMNIVVSDAELRAKLIAGGKVQIERFSEAAFRQGLSRHVVSPVSDLLSSSPLTGVGRVEGMR